ncbi:SRPBCC family protein [Streptomyces sp. B1866]|uniref:SRPBCC family protein n=1 Tax=Streptomyces sp. B1866 TaxID=3075431 RepID=UPI00288DB46A|nr:SRPBCC family protein [Streptomyces sp. B1866]MDT3398112.1 SRPBCC family protein [Streptomyces sp. B1866]
MRQLSADRIVPAPAADVFALLADPSRHREFDGSGTLRGRAADTGPVRGAGDRFGMDMRLGPFPYRTVNTVVTYEKNRVIGWQTWLQVGRVRVTGGHTWRYELAELGDDGTRVTEVYDWSTARYPRLAVEWPGFPRRTGPAMRTTLDRLATHFLTRP